MKKVSKNSQLFLEFNGTNIYFIDINGVNWIAINPICKALNIDARRCIRNLKNDPILASEVSKQALRVGENGIIQVRNMSCVSEKYIYGWIFSLTSDSNSLLEFKKECYEIIYNHFHGSIANRLKFIDKKAEKIVKNEQLFKILEKTKEYKDYIFSKEELSKVNKELNKQDNFMLGQKIKTLFDQDFILN